MKTPYITLGGALLPALFLLAAAPATACAEVTELSLIAEADLSEPAIVDENWTTEDCYAKKDCCARTPFYIMAEAVFYERDNGSMRRALAEDMDYKPVLYADDLDFDFEPGLRVRLGWERGPCACCSAWEFEYLGVFDWDASTRLTDPDNLFLPGDLGSGIVNGFVFADELKIDYSSDLHSFEWNCVRCWCKCCCQRWDLLCGFRYLTFGEKFNIASNNTPPQVNAAYRVNVDNNLYGYQIGARLRTLRTGCFNWEAVWKVGIYGNDAQQRQRIADNIGATPVDFRPTTGRSRSSVAFIGEIGVSLLYALSDVWNLRGGYNLLWIEGLALAPNQLDFTATPTSGRSIDTAGGVFAHGVNVGIEANW